MHQIAMEKRLGIAQLCILVAVLAFMALTRGSRGDSMDRAILPRLTRRNRTTSLSTEWTRRTSTRTNPRPPTRSLDSSIARLKGTIFAPPSIYLPASDSCITAASDDEKFEFPSAVTPKLDRLERTQHRNHNSTHTTSNSLKKNGNRARTPQTRTPRAVRVSTPTPPSFLRPDIVRANSQGNNGMGQSVSSSVIGSLPKSAKRWARTAHVHEIKRKSVDSGVSSQSEAEIETPNDSSSRVWLNKGKRKETEAMGHIPFILGENFSRRGSIGRSPLRPTSSTNVRLLDTEVTDSWVDTDEASSSETDVFLNRPRERLMKSTDTLTIHRPLAGVVGVGAS